MSRQFSSAEMTCLRDERDRLKDEIRQCDMCSSSLEEHRHCYEDVSKESGMRSKACFS